MTIPINPQAGTRSTAHLNQDNTSQPYPESGKLPASPPSPAPHSDRIDLSNDTLDSEGAISPSPLLGGLAEAYGDKLLPDASTEPVSAHRLAEEKDDKATIAVFDSFEQPLGPDKPTHGEVVEGVVQESGYGEEDTQRYEIPAGINQVELSQALVENKDAESLQLLVEDMATGMLDSTTGAMEEILNDESSQITTINQSQSTSPAQVTKSLLLTAAPPKPGETGYDPNAPQLSEERQEYREALAQSVGLDPDASDQELTQAVADEVSRIFNQEGGAIQQSQERYDQVSQQLADSGISHVVASGNYGDVEMLLDDRGVTTDDDFYRNRLGNDNTTVVEAVDDKGTESPSDDTPFIGNSPNAGADLSAPGVDRTMTTQDGRQYTSRGTSYAAPEVAGTVARLHEQYPHLTPQEIEDLLVSTAGSSEQVGTPILDSEAAFERAAQLS